MELKVFYYIINQYSITLLIKGGEGGEGTEGEEIDKSKLPSLAEAGSPDPKGQVSRKCGCKP